MEPQINQTSNVQYLIMLKIAHPSTSDTFSQHYKWQNVPAVHYRDIYH